MTRSSSYFGTQAVIFPEMIFFHKNDKLSLGKFLLTTSLSVSINLYEWQFFNYCSY